MRKKETTRTLRRRISAVPLLVFAVFPAESGPAVAIHEACPCVLDWHDESYAGLLAQVIGEIRDRNGEADIKAVLA